MSTILKANNTETPCEAAEHYRDSAWGRPTCTVTIKGKITLQYLPHELAGSYFKVVSA